MLHKTTINGILNDLYDGKYLGFSTAAPTGYDAGEITNFPEPASSTGYQRIECQMDAAADGVKTNGSQNLEWPAPNEGQSYGQATHIGIFSAKTGGTLLGAIPLSALVTQGLKNTLIIYKGKFLASMTVTDAAATETA